MFCKNKQQQIPLFLLLFITSLSAYENLTPAQVYQRLMAGDSLQLLDVREVSEYTAGHMAEPAGRPVMTPANTYSKSTSRWTNSTADAVVWG